MGSEWGMKHFLNLISPTGHFAEWCIQFPGDPHKVTEHHICVTWVLQEPPSFL